VKHTLILALLFAAVVTVGCSSGRLNRVERTVATQDEYTKELMSTADKNTKTINENSARIADMENRLSQIQTELKGIQTGDNATVREMKDNISFLNDQLARLDKSVTTTSRPASAQSSAPQAANAFRPSGFDVTTAYNAAMAEYQSRKYEAAIASFKEILTVAPTSSLADNAQYWIGECYYAMNNFDQALAAMTRVSADFPKSNKLADASVKTAMINQRLGKNDIARDQFRTVVANFPGTDASAIASKHLSTQGQ
jgi:tol-pal system protein YbgF